MSIFIQWINKLRHDYIFKGTFFLLVASVLAGLVNYLFNPIAARILGPEYFSELVASLSINTILSMPLVAAVTVVAKYIAPLKNQEQINYFAGWFFKKALFVNSLLILLYLTTISFLKDYLQLSGYSGLLAAAFCSFIWFFPSVSRGVLQGLKKFSLISFLTFFESVFKFLFGLIPIFIGFKAGGSILGMAIGSTILWLIIFKYIKPEKNKKFINHDLYKQIKRYSVLVIIVTTILTVFFNIDILIVKHYFSNETASAYSAISILSKTIFFIGSSLSFVIFPLVIEDKRQKKFSSPILFKSLGITLISSFIIIGIYYFFSSLIVRLFFGSEYMALSDSLWCLGIVFSLYSLAHIIITYYLAIHYYKVIYPIFLCLILLLISVVFFHQSVAEIINCFILNQLLLIIMLFTPVFKEWFTIFKKNTII